MCYEYPEAGMGVLVPYKQGMKMTTTIKAYITESQTAIRQLPLTERNCYFPDEVRYCFVNLCRIQIGSGAGIKIALHFNIRKLIALD